MEKWLSAHLLMQRQLNKQKVGSFIVGKAEQI